MRIVFMGTPDFALPSLKALLSQDDFEIVGVITQPDRARGRHSQLTPCPVKAFALEQGLDVYTFEKVRARIGRETIESLKPDVLVTAAFGQILSQRILDIPPLGCVNVHGSLLPKYRGAAPIQWSIINGDHTTGITTMLTEKGVDCGDILLQHTVEIDPGETAGELFDRLSHLGGQVLVDTLRGLLGKTITPQKQNDALATHCPMMTKANGQIDWNQSAQEVHNLVRGVNPWPGAYFHHGDRIIKVWRTEILDQNESQPGIVVHSKDTLDIACGKGVLRILEMQIPGKRRMQTSQILRGYAIQVGERLT